MTSPQPSDGGRMALADDLDGVPRDAWETTTVRAIMRTDLPRALPSWLLRDAIAAMEEADVNRLGVVDGQGGFVGVISAAGIVKLDEILGKTVDE